MYRHLKLYPGADLVETAFALITGKHTDHSCALIKVSCIPEQG